MIDGRITPTSPAREIQGLRHRIQRTEDALHAGRGDREANERELQLLRHLEQRWRREQDELRAAWCLHHERQWRNHVALARRHYTAWIRLLGMEEDTGDNKAIAPNGKAH